MNDVDVDGEDDDDDNVGATTAFISHKNDNDDMLN